MAVICNNVYKMRSLPYCMCLIIKRNSAENAINNTCKTSCCHFPCQKLPYVVSGDIGDSKATCDKKLAIRHCSLLSSSSRDRRMTSPVSTGTTQLSTFFGGRVAAFVELERIAVGRRRHVADGASGDTALETAGDGVRPPRTGEVPASTVDARLAARLRAVRVAAWQVTDAGVVLCLAVETLAAGEKTEHTA